MEMRGHDKSAHSACACYSSWTENISSGSAWHSYVSAFFAPWTDLWSAHSSTCIFIVHIKPWLLLLPAQQQKRMPVIRCCLANCYSKRRESLENTYPVTEKATTVLFYSLCPKGELVLSKVKSSDVLKLFCSCFCRQGADYKVTNYGLSRKCGYAWILDWCWLILVTFFRSQPVHVDPLNLSERHSPDDKTFAPL